VTFGPVVPLWLVLVLTAGALALCVSMRRGDEARRRRAMVRRVLLVAVLAAMAVRPGAAESEASGAATSLDVFFVVDRTASMVAEDWNGSTPRLTGVKADLTAIVRGLPGAQFMLLGFDNDVQTLLPLTSDATAAVNVVRLLRPEVTRYSSGSSLRLAAAQLETTLQAAEDRDDGRRRVVFVFADGEVTATSPSEQSYEPLGSLVDDGAVFGYGTTAGGRMRESAGRGESGPYIVDPQTGRDAISRIDEDALRAVADELGIDYERRVAPGGLGDVLGAIDTGGRASTDDTVPVRADRGWLLALVFLALVQWEVAALARSVVVASTLAGVGRRATAGSRA